MEAAVEDVAARLRERFADVLRARRASHGEEEASGAIPKRSARVFAPLPSRKRALAAGATAHEVDWRGLLLTLCRRYAGALAVEGKLLNKEEIQVRRIARVDGAAAESGACVALAKLDAPFIVRCRDAPTDRIGSAVCAVAEKPHARMVSGSDDSPPAVVYRAEGITAKTELDITAMESVFGFDVAQFTGLPVSRRRRVDDDSDDDEQYCANTVVLKHSTFSDLRGVRRMMEANHLGPLAFPSLVAASTHGCTDHEAIDEKDSWSYVALGAAQKTLWAHERVTRGDALRDKGRLRECLVEYSSAVRLEDEHADALLKRGQVFIELKQYEDAIRDFEVISKNDPANDAALQGLLRAKGKLSHSKHVTGPTFRGRSPRSTSRERRRERQRSVSRTRRDGGGDRDSATAAIADLESEAAEAFEKDRLRRLLEEDEKKRKRSRKKSSRRRSESSSSGDDGASSDSDDESQRRSRSSKSSRKKAKKCGSSRDRKKRSKKSSRHRERDDRRRRKRSGSASPSSASDSSSYSRQRSRRRDRRRERSRSRSTSRRRDGASRSKSVTTGSHHDETQALHPILARKPHRLWN